MTKRYPALSKFSLFIISSIFIIIFFWLFRKGLWFLGIIPVVITIFGVFLEFFCPYIKIDDESITFGRRFLNMPIAPQTEILWNNIVSVHTINAPGPLLMSRTDIEYEIAKNDKRVRKTKRFSTTMGFKAYKDLLSEIVSNATKAAIDEEAIGPFA
jgi:hypothetical protein